MGGTVWGWPAPLIPELQSTDSPIDIRPVTDDEASWLSSVVSLSRLVTLPAYVYMNDKFGRKFTSHMIALPFVVGWSMMLFADSVNLLYWGRLVIGVAAGGAAILVPAYTGDIAEDCNKGRLGVGFGLTMNLGITFSYAVGFYASYLAFHLVLVLLPLVFVAGFRWLPESPMFLLTAGKPDEARAALQWFRGGRDCGPELERMRQRAAEVLERRQNKVSLWATLDRPTLRGLLICLGVMTNQLLSGLSPVVAYTVTIFQAAGSSLPPNLCAILVGVVQTAGTVLSALVIEWAGRRPLLICSNLVVAACLFVLGTHFYLQGLGWDLTSLGWVPLLSLSCYIFTLGLAITPLPFTLTTETIGPHARGAAQSAVLMYLSVGMFGLVQTYTALARLVGQHGCFWLYAGACLASGLCVYLFVPETKNRSLEDVVQQLGGDNYIRSVVRPARSPEPAPK
ncbi:facilitated trehalose transporter Tret1-like isoform X2 [Bacillus rossius redtenbacheri]